MKISNNIDFRLPNFYENNVKDDNQTIGIDFKSMLMSSINKLNEFEKESDEMGMKLVTGEIDNIHDVMIAGQKAEIALQFAIEIRNKVLDAYREIMRIQI